jgi:Spy/CpxP family protein refolding chaperone
VNTWKVILATVVIFVAGVLTGGLLVHHSNQSGAVQKNPEMVHTASLQNTNASREFKLPPPLMGPLRKDFVDRLQRELKITAPQKERIEKIICDGQEQTRIIWEEIAPDMHETIIETKEKIRAELTPEQQSKFQELFKPKARMPAKPVSPTNTAPASVTNSINAK